MVQRIRYYIFLRDVLTLALTTFGGPQAHLAHFHKVLVDKRGYLSDEELMEINSLCQILPGPASTQTLTAIAFKIGGPNLAYLTLLVWILPAVALMTTAAVIMSVLKQIDIRVPKDVLIAGFDDMKYGKVLQPSLTTYRQPLRDIVNFAYDMMVNHTTKSLATDISLSGEVVARESTVFK